ncbi:hypothetical protein AtEden1_Chr2g0230221 [Arabidopsis thaliana]
MVALAMVCRRHRFVVDSHMVRTLKFWMGNVEPYLYVYMQMHQNPSPWWFVHHPMQRLLKPVQSSLCPFLESGLCFVR